MVVIDVNVIVIVQLMFVFIEVVCGLEVKLLFVNKQKQLKLVICFICVNLI